MALKVPVRCTWSAMGPDSLRTGGGEIAKGLQRTSNVLDDGSPLVLLSLRYDRNNVSARPSLNILIQALSLLR